MAIVIDTFIQKGGVGKTTTVINLGSYLSQKKYKVLLIDGETQMSLTRFFFKNDPDVFDQIYLRPYIKTLRDLLEQKCDVEDAVLTRFYSVKRKVGLKFKTVSFSIDVIPGGSTMENMSFETPYELKNILNKIDPKYDFILIDCPPAFSDFTYQSMAAADYLLIPSETQDDSLVGLFEAQSRCFEMIDSGINPDLRILGLFFTKVMSYKTDQSQLMEAAREDDSGLFLNSFIRFDYSSMRMSKELCTPLNALKKSNAGSDFESLADEILQKIKKEIGE